MSCLYTLEINPLSVASFANIFSHAEGCLFFLFIVSSAVQARTQKQPKCPLTDEWIKKMWYIYTVEYYSAIKRNEIELFVVRWMDLESVIQSEVRKRKTNTVC